jgi:rare lipoprotein A
VTGFARSAWVLKGKSRSGESVPDINGLTTVIALGVFCVFGALAPLSSASAEQTASIPMPERPKSFSQTGMASFYSIGGRTASGAKSDPQGMTAAHRRLPFGSRVVVTHLKTGKQVIVTINDRGPFRKGRIIDLSKAAAHRLGITQYGVARVRVTALD